MIWKRKLGHLLETRLQHLSRLGLIQILEQDMKRPLNCVRYGEGKSHAKGYTHKAKNIKTHTRRTGE